MRDMRKKMEGLRVFFFFFLNSNNKCVYLILFTEVFLVLKLNLLLFVVGLKI